MINLELAVKQQLSEDEVFKIEQLHYSRRPLHDAITQALSAGNKTVVRLLLKLFQRLSQSFRSYGNLNRILTTTSSGMFRDAVVVGWTMRMLSQVAIMFVIYLALFMEKIDA